MCRPLRRHPPTLQTRTLPAGKPALWPCRTEKTMSCEWLGTSAPQPVIFGLSRTLNRVTRHSQEGHIVAQRMHGYALAEVCLFCGGMDGAVQLPRAERIHRIEARKQPSALEHATLRVGHAPPDTQALEQDRREDRGAGAAALALLDAQRHALAVDVADLQRHHFARTQPGTVGDRQCRLVLQVAGCGDQAGHLVRAEHDW